jgi:citrate lyase subunit beta / citryl-CoA lyase
MRAWFEIHGNQEPPVKSIIASGCDALIIQSQHLNSINPSWLSEATSSLSIFIRISPLTSINQAAELKYAMQFMPSGIILPCSEKGADIQQLGARIAVYEAQYSFIEKSTKIIGVVETATSLMHLASYKGASSRLIGLILDKKAICEHISADSYNFAQNLVIIATKSASILSISDALSGSYNDTKLELEDVNIENSGFDVKIIHKLYE